MKREDKRGWEDEEWINLHVNILNKLWKWSIQRKKFTLHTFYK